MSFPIQCPMVPILIMILRLVDIEMETHLKEIRLVDIEIYYDVFSLNTSS